MSKQFFDLSDDLKKLGYAASQSSFAMEQLGHSFKSLFNPILPCKFVYVPLGQTDVMPNNEPVEELPWRAMDLT